MKTAKLDGELLYVKFDQLTQRYASLQAVLFEEGKFNFIPGKVFDHLPPDQQHVLRRMFCQLARLLYSFLRLSQKRNLSPFKPAAEDDPFDIQLSPDQVQVLFTETDVVPRHGNPRLRFSLTNISWAASNMKHVESFITEYDDWLERIRETMEGFWWPLTFLEKFSNLQALETDKDIETSGMITRLRLRKLLLNDSPVPPTFQLTESMGSLSGLHATSVELRKTGNLSGQDVLVEIMPYKRDENNFMPIELKRRYCMIAALLNTQNTPELNVLRCLCWRQEQEFDGPKFKTLKEMILLRRSNLKPSLDCRLGMAHILAQTISECLSVGWRHRSIRSNNVLFFLDKDPTVDNRGLGNPFLCGFEESRLQDDYSMNMHGDNSLESNVYRHPDRWSTPKAKFRAEHDIYSFGVILLEIALWLPIMSILKGYQQGKSSSHLAGEDVKILLLEACKNEVEHKCGSRYRRMIEMCLKMDFGIEEGSDTRLQTKVQVVFRQEVRDALRESQSAVTLQGYS